MEDILNKYWKENAKDVILDTSFVNDVIYPAMKEFAETQKADFTIEEIEEYLETKNKSVIDTQELTDLQDSWSNHPG